MKVLVVGAGVVGLTTAVELARAGLTVEVWARELTPRTTSDVAAAFWYPYAAYPIERVMEWALTSFRQYEQLERVATCGVSRRTVTKLFRDDFATPSWTSMTQDYREYHGNDIPAGFSGALSFTTYVIDMTMYMPFLMQLCEETGSVIRDREISNLADVPPSYEIVVNCTGLGARELVGDLDVVGVKGQVVRVRTAGYVPDHITLDESVHDHFTMIVPRGNDIVLGGTYEEEFENDSVDPAEVRRIVESCQAVAPELKNLDVIGANCGLRPVRSTVRLEREQMNDGRYVIHNYGHGGAGVTLSWGCAEGVVDMVRSSQMPATAK